MADFWVPQCSSRRENSKFAGIDQFQEILVTTKESCILFAKRVTQDQGVIQNSGRCSLENKGSKIWTPYFYGPGGLYKILYWNLKSFCSIEKSSFQLFLQTPHPELQDFARAVSKHGTTKAKEKVGHRLADKRSIVWGKPHRFGLNVKKCISPNSNPLHTNLVNHHSAARNKSNVIWMAWLLSTTSYFYGCGLNRRWRKSSLVLLWIPTAISSWRGDWVIDWVVHV